MKFKLEETIRVKRRNLEEDTTMPKFHMVFTVDGVKSEQDISAVSVQKAEELIKKQYTGQSVNFMSKQEIERVDESYSKSDLYSALEYMYGFNKKEANDWIKKADDKTKQSVVDAFKDNAKKSFLTDSLHEDFEENPVEVKEDAVEESERVPQTENEVGLSNLIIQEINGEWETIQHYNDLISLMRAQGYDDMIDVISDIVAEENTHIGQLQKCLQIISPNVSKIEAGETEAIEQLSDDECLTCLSAEDACVEYECDFEPDDDFGEDSGFEAYF